MPTLAEQYESWTRSVGFARLPGRSQLEITGRDRVRLLHGLCTNDIKRLQPGDGCEAFLTNGQGRTIGYVCVFCGPDSLWIDSAAGQAATIQQSLDRYVVREDVQFHDRTHDWTEWLVGGPRAAETLASWIQSPPPTIPLNQRLFSIDGEQMACRRVLEGGPDGYLLAGPNRVADRLEAHLRSADAVECSEELVEVLRVEAGIPRFGQDVRDDNLPQEIDRVPQTISFQKGCYLGQETVARLDALGHVNRTLCRVRIHGAELPPVGGEVSAGDKVVAKITSSVWSPSCGGPLVLAYVRRGSNQPGQRLVTPWGEGEVLAP